MKATVIRQMNMKTSDKSILISLLQKEEIHILDISLYQKLNQKKKFEIHR